jgi:ADP-heptose:LPS heptosyltransferase
LKRVLVIRLGALGDFVLSFPAFAAIRAHHPDARITLLTTAPFAPLGQRAPWFDHVEIDARPGWWNLRGLTRLMRQLSGYGFVYDLQTSSRSSQYFRLAGRPLWSGIARGASHPDADPQRDRRHTVERQRGQLLAAGIGTFPAADLEWLVSGAHPDVLRAALAADVPADQEPASRRAIALLVPGASPHRPEKRWPAEHFGALACKLAQRGLAPVVIGTAAERPLAATILSACPATRDLTGRTDIADIAALAARATLAVGNDTGPMHLAAAMGCPSVVLFSAASDPALTAPRGPGGTWPTVLRVDDLADLPVERVAAALP